MNATIHFHIRLERPAKDGSVPIYLVFLIDRHHRTKISLGQSVPLKPQYRKLAGEELLAIPMEQRKEYYSWDENTERCIPATHPVNRMLDKAKARAIGIMEKFELMERPLTTELFQSAFCKPKGSNNFSEYFEKQVLEKRRHTLSSGTLKNFSTTISLAAMSHLLIGGVGWQHTPDITYPYAFSTLSLWNILDPFFK